MNFKKQLFFGAIALLTVGLILLLIVLTIKLRLVNQVKLIKVQAMS